MKLNKKQISGITNFYIDNLSISLDVSKRYNLNLWSEGTQKQGSFAKTLYFDDTLEEWRMRDCACENKNKSLDFSVVIEQNTLKSLETLKAYGVDNGGIAIFSEVYFELHEIGGGGGGEQSKSIEIVNSDYDASKITENYLTYFTQATNKGPYFKVGEEIIALRKTTDFREGEITRVTIVNNSLVIERRNQSTLIYNLLTDATANCVKITANANSTIELTNYGNNTPNLQKSVDGVNWSNYSNVISIERGESVLLRGNNPEGFSFNGSKYSNIVITGDVSISGNVMGLLDNGAGTATQIPNSYCFHKLFMNSTGITSISKNFLPATSLTEGCYSYMFFGCTSLIDAPKLPATTLTNYCYTSMFSGCISLTTAPVLPAYTLAEGCYSNMLAWCTSLFSVKIAFNGNFGDITNSFTGWLEGVPSYGLIYYNGSDTSGIPNGWQKITF